MKFWKYVFIILLLLLFLGIVAALQIPDNNLHLIACNVGQGDATLLIYKKNQILVDGGPDTKVLSCLGKYLPFWDRELELVILTHPDLDHFGGLPEVFKRYKVINYLYNPVTISKQEYGVLENTVGREGVRGLYPHQGQRLRVGMIQLDTLAPAEQLSDVSYQITDEKILTDAETNDYSIVSLVRFGKFIGLLTGDMTSHMSDELSSQWVSGSVNYIKIPHHGSKNGTTINLLMKVMPEFAVISVGKNNYGHPAEEILGMLDRLKIKYLRTDKSGDIEVITDGEKIRVVQKN